MLSAFFFYCGCSVVFFSTDRTPQQKKIAFSFFLYNFDRINIFTMINSKKHENRLNMLAESNLAAIKADLINELNINDKPEELHASVESHFELAYKHLREALRLVTFHCEQDFYLNQI